MADKPFRLMHRVQEPIAREVNYKYYLPWVWSEWERYETQVQAEAEINAQTRLHPGTWDFEIIEG